MKEKTVIDLLLEDHKHVRTLLEQLTDSTERAEKRRETLLKSIGEELRIHTKVEEEIVYPALKEVIDEKDEEERVLYYEAREEHHVVELLLPELEQLDATTPEFSAKATVLEELVGHHADEEQKEIFPILRSRIEREELVALAERVLARKEELKGSGLTPRRRPRHPGRGEVYATH